MSRSKIVWTLKIVVTFKDGDVQIVERPCSEARKYFRYLISFCLDYNFKCVREISLCDSRLKPIKQFILYY